MFHGGLPLPIAFYFRGFIVFCNIFFAGWGSIYLGIFTNYPFNDGQFYIDEETFMDEMVAAYPKVFTRLDGWASHSYPKGPFTEGPWQQSYGVDWLNEAVNPDQIKPPSEI